MNLKFTIATHHLCIICLWHIWVSYLSHICVAYLSHICVSPTLQPKTSLSFLPQLLPGSATSLTLGQGLISFLAIFISSVRFNVLPFCSYILRPAALLLSLTLPRNYRFGAKKIDVLSRSIFPVKNLFALIQPTKRQRQRQRHSGSQRQR